MVSFKQPQVLGGIQTSSCKSNEIISDNSPYKIFYFEEPRFVLSRAKNSVENVKIQRKEKKFLNC